MQENPSSPREQSKTYVWWSAAQAVTFLRDGMIPTKVNWRQLPDATAEIQILNAAIQAGTIGVIEVPLSGDPHELELKDKAFIEVRFRQVAIYSNIGVSLEVLDTQTGERRRQIKDLKLKADHIRALRDSVPTEVAPGASSSAQEADPRATETMNCLTGTAKWISAEAKRMNAAAEIPSRITDFAKRLETRMLNANKTDRSLRPVGWRHIKNKLPEWGLWPVKSIK